MAFEAFKAFEAFEDLSLLRLLSNITSAYRLKRLFSLVFLEVQSGVMVANLWVKMKLLSRRSNGLMTTSIGHNETFGTHC